MANNSECGMTMEQMYQESMFADACRESGKPEEIKKAEIIERRLEAMAIPVSNQGELQHGVAIDPAAQQA